MSVNSQKLHHFLDEWNTWKHEYHSNPKGDVIFQNQKLLTNIKFTTKSFHAIRNNLKGFEQLPETVMNPSEVWSRWANPEKQTVTLRTYIKGNYVVQTTDGEITNAYLVENISKYRQGVIVL